MIFPHILYFGVLTLLHVAKSNAWCLWWDGPVPILLNGNATTAPDTVCSVDPTDGSSLQLLFEGDYSPQSPCYGQENIATTFDVAIVYEGVDNITSTFSTTTSAPANFLTVTMDFNVAMTAIADGSIATALVQNSDPVYLTNPYPSPPYAFTWTQTQIQSIFYAIATTTVNTTFTTQTTTTTVTTETDSTTLPAPTVTAPCTTGTKIVTAAAKTTTIISTITPPPRTIHEVEVIIVRSTLSCLPNSPLAGHVRSQVSTTNYELPNCGSVTPTTYTTSTSVFFSNFTEIDTDTSTSTSTMNVTITPTTAVTQCRNVRVTSTVTPPAVVRTGHTLARRQTVTDVTTIEIIETVLPRHPQLCFHNRVPPQVTFNGQGHGHIHN